MRAGAIKTSGCAPPGDVYEQSAAGIAAQVLGLPPVGVNTDAAQLEVVKDPPDTVVLVTMSAAEDAALFEA